MVLYWWHIIYRFIFILFINLALLEKLLLYLLLYSNEKIITKSKYTNTENSKISSKQKYADVYKLTILWPGTFWTLLSWVNWPRKWKIYFYFWTGWSKCFFGVLCSTQLLCITSALRHIRKTAGPICQCLSLFSHSWHTHMTGSNMDVMKGNGGGDADEHAQH